MPRKALYLILAIVGSIVSICFEISLVTPGHSNGAALLRQLFGTPISAFFAVDLILSSIVFVSYLRRETASYSIPRRWAWFCAAGLLTLGLGFAFPLFLYARESQIETDEPGR